MSRRIAALLALAVVTAPAVRAHDTAESEPAPAPPKTGPVVVGPAKPAPPAGVASPLALPRVLPGDHDDVVHAATDSVPPFFGVFGPAELLAHTGFTSKPGDWIEFKVVSRQDATVVLSTLRVSHVAPAVEQGAWLEISGGSDASGEAATRMLTRGRGNGNVYRLIARMGGLPAMDLPLTSLSLAPDEAAALAAGPATITRIGTETVTVPLGTFKCEHWRVVLAGRNHDYFIAEDRKVPFNRVVKMNVDEGIAVAAARGTDAVAKVAIPKAP